VARSSFAAVSVVSFAQSYYYHVEGKVTRQPGYKDSLYWVMPSRLVSCFVIKLFFMPRRAHNCFDFWSRAFGSAAAMSANDPSGHCAMEERPLNADEERYLLLKIVISSHSGLGGCNEATRVHRGAWRGSVAGGGARAAAGVATDRIS
jgi:hypothetical protein